MATFFKCTRANGTDFRTGKHGYLRSLETGKPLRIKAGPVTGGVCGVGFHVSPTARQTIQFADRMMRPWRWFEVWVEPEHVIEFDSEKSRVSELQVTREIFLADIFGEAFAQRIEAVKADIETWKAIPWLKPAKAVSKKKIDGLFCQWHAAIRLWTEKALPAKLRIVQTPGAAGAAGAAAAYRADEAVAAEAVAAEAVAAEAVAAEAAAAEAVAAEAATAAAAEAVAAEAAADSTIRIWRLRWYVRPYRCLLHHARWAIAGIEKPNPWQPLIEMFRLGCLPIGYADGEFVVYVPKMK